MQFIYATWPSIVNYIYRSFFIATSLLRIITIETAFRYSLRRYFAFHSSKWITMGNPSTRLFINNLDNRYNYVNLTEGKRRVSTLLLSGRKKHRIRSTEQQPYNVSFFSLSLSPPSFTLFDGFARNLKHASRFFTNLATSVAREGVVIDFSPHFYRVSSADFPTKSWKRSHRSSKFFSITKKKKKTNSIKNDSLYIYI